MRRVYYALSLHEDEKARGLAVVVTVGAVLPWTPLAGSLEFVALPPGFVLFVVAAVVTYLPMVEAAKRIFCRRQPLAPSAR